MHGEGDAERVLVRGRTGLVGATATCLGTHEAVALALRTMGLGSRGSLALFIVGALVVLALLKAAVDSADTEGKWLRGSAARAPDGSALPTGVPQLGSGCEESSLCLRLKMHGANLDVTGWG